MMQSTDVFVTWANYHQLIESLAVKIYDSGWEFNQILCLARGGLRVGDILSRIYNQPLAILSVSSYHGKAFQMRGEVQFAQALTMSTPQLGDRILLVDDLMDSGATMAETFQWLHSHHQVHAHNCRTAVLWYKASSQLKPDYFVEYFADSPWIHQPFEPYENLELQELIQRHRSTGSMMNGSW